MEATVENIDKLDIAYDKQRDVLYISFGKPKEADESKLTDNDVIVRYRHGKVVGLTMISFSKRLTSKHKTSTQHTSYSNNSKTTQQHTH